MLFVQVLDDVNEFPVPLNFRIDYINKIILGKFSVYIIEKLFLVN